MIIQFKKDYSKYKTYANTARKLDRIAKQIEDLEEEMRMLMMDVITIEKNVKDVEFDLYNEIGGIKIFQYKKY